jgi:hypothetical protein
VSPSELLALLADVPAARSSYGVRDDRGQGMDTLKVIGNPAGGYLAVYHCGTANRFAVHLATSPDLLTWTHRAMLDARASQPTIAAVPGGGFLVAVEAGGGGRPGWLRFACYPDLDRLLAGDAARVFDAPHTLAPARRLAEGTPNVYSATFTPDGGHSVIDVGFHYLRRAHFWRAHFWRGDLWWGDLWRGDVDRQARGTLVDFRRWTTEPQPHVDRAIEAFDVAGNIGGRDRFTWRGRRYSLIEGQLRKRRWDSWRVFLYDWSAGTARPVPIRTHGGSTAFGNPTVTMLTAPSGEPAIVVTAYLFPVGAAPGEDGPLLYYRELPPPGTA